MTDIQYISPPEEVDEFLLAAYLSDGLPKEIRQEIELYLLGNSDARDLLGLASHALDGARTSSSPRLSDGPVKTTLMSEPGSKPRTPIVVAKHSFSDNLFLRMQIGIATIPIFVIVVGLLIWSLFPKMLESTPQLTIAAALAAMWVPTLDAAEKTITWPAVAAASNYAVVVYNPEDNSIVNLATTNKTSLSDLQALAYTYRDAHPGVLSIWVMALDTGGNVIRSSTAIKLVSNRYAL